MRKQSEMVFSNSIKKYKGTKEEGYIAGSSGIAMLCTCGEGEAERARHA